MKWNLQFMGSVVFVWGRERLMGEAHEIWGLSQRDQCAPFPAPYWPPSQPFFQVHSACKNSCALFAGKVTAKGHGWEPGCFSVELQGGEAQELNYKFLQSSQEAGSPDCGCSVLRAAAPSARLTAAPDAFRRHSRTAAGRPGKEAVFPHGLVNPHVVFRQDVPVCTIHIVSFHRRVCAACAGRGCCSAYVHLCVRDDGTHSPSLQTWATPLSFRDKAGSSPVNRSLILWSLICLEAEE